MTRRGRGPRVRRIARREYRAVGIHVALAARLAAAYFRGFQGDELGPASVACMTKHFPGGGPQADGEDPHFPYGKDQIYPGAMFEYHLRVGRLRLHATDEPGARRRPGGDPSSSTISTWVSRTRPPSARPT